MINKSSLFEGLRQFASRKIQETLWLNGSDSRMSSFTEAMSYVFDDAGIARAIETGYLQKHFSEKLCRKMDELRRLLHKIPANDQPRNIILHPKMDQIRVLAAELLDLFSTESSSG
jgi:hypothetical protein